MHDPAIGEGGGRGHIARAVISRESDYACNLLRACHAPERYSRIELRKFAGIADRAEIDRRRYCPRADPNDQNLVLGEFETGGAREHAHAAFGEAVGSIA